jgi:DNA repair protein RadC
MKIKDIPIENQPRERLKRNGIDSLSNAELLAIILQKGSKNENVIDLSNRLLSIPNFNEMSIQELQKIKGIGEAKSMQIKAIFELNKRLGNKQAYNKEITCAKDVYDIMYFLKDKKKEHLYGLYLDTKNKVIDKPELISIGILDASLIHPREIFTQAIRKSAKSMILVHNHPSGDTNPSDEDINVTNRLMDAAKLLEIKLLDHVIIGNEFFSFREKGLLN